MIGLDTNIIVRYLTQDDARQCKKVNRLVDEELGNNNKGYITLITLVEITWVLESCYEQDKEALIAVIGGLLTTKQFYVERADIAFLALRKYKDGNGDFSDALIAISSIDAGCEKVVTFDKKAVTAGMELLK